MVAAKQVTATRRLLVAAGPLARAAAPSLLLAVPPLATALVLFAVLMGPTGMHPRDVAEAARASLAVRTAILAVALAALSPAAVALGRAEIGYFRWLPVPAAAFWLTGLAFAVAINAPFALFWVAAAGPVAALVVLVGGAAFHASLLCRGAPRVFLAGAAFASLVVPASFSLSTAVVGVALLAVAIRSGWRHIAEARTFAFAPMPSGRPTRAIATVLAADVVRPMLVVRIAVAAVVFGGLGGLLISNNRVSESASALIVIAVSALGCVGVAAHLASSATASWHEMRWLFRANATPPFSQAAALLATVCIGALVCGLAIAAAAVVVGGISWPFAAVPLGCGGVSAVAVAAVAAMTAAQVSARQRMYAWIAALVAAVLIAAGAAALGLPVIVVLPLSVAASAVVLHDAAGQEVLV